MAYNPLKTSKFITQLALEYKILLACASPSLNADAQENLRQLVTSELNWEYLISISLHHRLLPLLYVNLTKYCGDLIPGSEKNRLSTLYNQSLAITLSQAAALKRIARLFEQNDVHFLVIKGWGLVERLYKNIALRQSHDVDILVQQRDVARAAHLLKSLGFVHEKVPAYFDFDSQLGAHFLKWCPEASFLDRQCGVYVDLHWKLARNDFEFPIDRRELWKLENHCYCADALGNFRTFSDSIHFVYLCYHGAKHEWRRLHWLCDAALMLRQAQLNWTTILTFAETLGILPTIGLAVMLCHQLFNCEIPPALFEQPNLLTRAQYLAKKNIATIVRGETIDGTRVSFLRSFKNLAWAFQMQTHWSNRTRIWTHLVAPSIKDLNLIKLADNHVRYYRLLRLLRWMIVLPIYAMRNSTAKLISVFKTK